MAQEEKFEESKDVVIDNRFWMKDGKGRGSVTLTFLTISFVLTAIAYVASMIAKAGPLEFREFDVGACTSFFGMCCALYFGRSYTKAKV